MFIASNSLYYKPITIINDNSSVVNKLETSLTDDTRVINYNHHMFIVQATRLFVPDKPFQPSLVFLDKARAFLRKQIS
jgi:hypothetical protein